MYYSCVLYPEMKTPFWPSRPNTQAVPSIVGQELGRDTCIHPLAGNTSNVLSFHVEHSGQIFGHHTYVRAQRMSQRTCKEGLVGIRMKNSFGSYRYYNMFL